MQIKLFDQPSRSTPLLALAALIFAAVPASADLPAYDGVAYGQPKVVPGEFTGDISKLPSLQKSVRAPRAYRPRLPGPPSTKFLTQVPLAPSAPEPFGGPRPPMPPTVQNFAGLNFN